MNYLDTALPSIDALAVGVGLLVGFIIVIVIGPRIFKPIKQEDKV